MRTMTNEHYHADTSRIGKSGLDLIARSPAHYWAKYLDPYREPEKRTPALIVGSAVHKAILEPNDFANAYAVMPELNLRTNAGKDSLAAFTMANEGKEIIDTDTFKLAMRMRDAVHAHPAAALFLKSGIAEQTIHWDDLATGAKCKARPDFLSSNTDFIVDIKSTEDASPEGFGRSAIKYRYHVQGAWYLDGYLSSQGKPAKGFVFIAVEKEPPFNVGVYYLTDEAYALGKSIYLRDLNTYVECLQTNKWGGYSSIVEPLKLPAYALK